MPLKVNLIIYFLFISFNVIGQVDLRNFDYSKADSIALNFPKKEYKFDTELALLLTSNLETDHEKFRVIFRWITDNISYSFSNRSCNSLKVLKKRKAVCSGYSYLLKSMCDYVKIECEVITGYSKADPIRINKKLTKSDHSWNAVKLNGEWYLVDATWAWGYRNKKKKFIKEFDNNYFLSEIAFFNSNHYPQDKKWQKYYNVNSKSKFKKSPILYGICNQMKIDNLYPNKGIIKTKINKDITLSFTSDSIVNQIGYVLQSKTDYIPIAYTLDTLKDGKKSYTCNLKFEKRLNSIIYFIVNKKSAFSYKILMK